MKGLKRVFSALNGRLAKIQEALTTIHSEEREIREAYETAVREREALFVI